MGVDDFQYGDDEYGLIILQDTFGTAKKPAGTNAFRALSLAMGQPKNRIEVRDRRGTRSLMERQEGRTPVQPWTTTVILRPSGTAGTPPDIGDLLKLAFGTETVVASTSVTYSPLKDATGLFASIYRNMSTMMEGVYDAVVTNVSISWSGDDFITITFSGEASEFIEASRAEANGSGSGATALIVDDADFFTKYAILQNISQSDDNGGAGYHVPAISHSTETLTIDPAASWDNNDEWGGFLPSGTYTGDPLYGTNMTLSIDGGSTTINSLSGSIDISTGQSLLNREAGTSQASDVIVAERRVSGSISFLVKEDETYIESHARRKVAKDFQLVFGDTAGAIVTVNMNNVELDPGQRGTQETGPVEYTLGYVAMGSGSGENEIEIVQT